MAEIKRYSNGESVWHLYKSKGGSYIVARIGNGIQAVTSFEMLTEALRYLRAKGATLA